MSKASHAMHPPMTGMLHLSKPYEKVDKVMIQMLLASDIHSCCVPLTQEVVASSTKAALSWLEDKDQRLLMWDAKTRAWGPTKLGRATVASGLSITEALSVEQVRFCNKWDTITSHHGVRERMLLAGGLPNRLTPIQQPLLKPAPWWTYPPC